MDSRDYQRNIDDAAAWLAAAAILPDGAILHSPGRIVPYFSNQAALGMSAAPPLRGHAVRWLEWYRAHMNWPDRWGLYGTVYDHLVEGDLRTSTGHADSTDGYAATFLSAAAALHRAGDPAPRARIAGMRYPLDIVGGILVTTKQDDGLIWARPDLRFKYLIDNCEAYQALRDLSYLFRDAFADEDAARFYAAHAEHVRAGIERELWSEEAGGWLLGKDEEGRKQVPTWARWYPDSVAQLFPALTGVLGPGDERAGRTYAAFCRAWPGWPALDFPDPFPWALVPYAAALAGDAARVDAYLATVRARFAAAGFPWPWHCGEAGWFLRTNARMLGARSG